MISSQLNSANKSIQIIMAWFTDELLLNKLIAKAHSGVLVELILMDRDGSNLDNQRVSDNCRQD